MDSAGDDFIADTGSDRIDEVNAATGVLTTLSDGGQGSFGDDGPASFAALAQPVGIALDASGDLWIADSANNRIQEIANGVVVKVTQAAPGVAVTDVGGTYDGSPYAATATVDGVSGLEGVTPVISYYSGTVATGTALGAAPIAAGTYTVVARFAGSTDYTSGSASANFTIGKAIATVSMTDAGGEYTGLSYLATETVNGGNALEGVLPSLAFYFTLTNPSA